MAWLANGFMTLNSSHQIVAFLSSFFFIFVYWKRGKDLVIRWVFFFFFAFNALFHGSNIIKKRKILFPLPIIKKKLKKSQIHRFGLVSPQNTRIMYGSMAKSARFLDQMFQTKMGLCSFWFGDSEELIVPRGVFPCPIHDWSHEPSNLGGRRR